MYDRQYGGKTLTFEASGGLINSSLVKRKVLRKDPEWAAPLLWRSEFRNVLILTVRQGLLSLDQAAQLMEEAEFLMREREYQVASARVLELASQSGCSAYDCEFVALAQDLNTSLVTSDKQLLDAFPSLAQSMEAFV